MKKLFIVLLSAVFFGSMLTAGYAKEPVKIRIAYYADQKPAENMAGIINEFQKAHPNVKVQISWTDWDSHYEKLKTELAAGGGPTVYLLDSVYIQGYAGRGLLEDLSRRVKIFSKEKYSGLDAVKDPRGKSWAVPQGIQLQVLYYNKDMFDKAGVKYPTANWTTDDMLAAAKKLTLDTNGDGKIDQWGICLPNHIRWGWYSLIRTFGGDVMDKTRTRSTIKKDPRVKAALQFMHDTWYKYKVSPTLKDAEGVLTPKYHTYFARKIVAMWMDNFSRRIDSDQAGINYDIQFVPKGPGPKGTRYSAIVANSWVLNKAAFKAEKDAGWEFIKFYMSDKGQSMYAEGGEALPSSKAACAAMLKKLGKPEHNLIYLDSMKYTDTMGENAVWEEWYQVVQDGLQEYLTNRVPLDDCLNKLDSNLQKVLDDWYKKK
ncbi:carbohydrate ABC transporter substrate-binding protein (CUT1 family) [Hydrogenispora ethanolica]|uniref:Carbohydrate ABC transporter substrate-binding protein (CUT1 family) n=1 Tax=Hydrogenispora ethanolica TaxID=1082276 RepID=A0A4R1RI55_HYDET|nr:sugar ABC transporter substrate-binding protein [Hydrogenispora ethanolica]TCL65322.1 carbohydrate ABC transporter substrate-binding protein (CUT1 family) [Hydrogenispora ethanolica]